VSKNYQDTKGFWRLFWATCPEYADELDRGPRVPETKRMICIHAPFFEDVNSFCELGLGNGRNVHYFHKIFPEWIYRGNDINPNVHKAILSRYPDVLDYSDIEIADTLEYLKTSRPVDMILTCAHLMHIPDSVIEDVCALMAEKARKFILVSEAHSSPPETVWRMGPYRLERDYRNAFPGFGTIRAELRVTQGGCRYALCLFGKRAK